MNLWRQEFSEEDPTHDEDANPTMDRVRRYVHRVGRANIQSITENCIPSEDGHPPVLTVAIYYWAEAIIEPES